MVAWRQQQGGGMARMLLVVTMAVARGDVEGGGERLIGIGVASSSSVRRPKCKDNNLKKIVLQHTKSKSTSKDVKKSHTSVSLVSNKHDTLNSNVSESNANVLKAKTVNAVHHGLNLVCLSCGNDVFMISHDKCAAHEAPEMIIKFINQIQQNMKVQVLKVRSDNGMKFENKKLRNQKLVEAARTMFIFSRSPEFLSAEAISTPCFTQTHSLVHTRYNKTPYELIKGRKPNVQYFYVFGSLCDSTNDRDDLGKIKPKIEIGIFIGYYESLRGFRIYNRKTRMIMETIHVKFNELTTMASECNSSRPGLNCSNF
nr:retrovirus-related Pol polyprotein from transposon TNT 1-94 [Tanacetum cinerariifolium]